jgi:hypothetical protein
MFISIRSFRDCKLTLFIAIGVLIEWEIKF